jgi:hypothetical protein
LLKATQTILGLRNDLAYIVNLRSAETTFSTDDLASLKNCKGNPEASVALAKKWKSVTIQQSVACNQSKKLQVMVICPHCGLFAFMLERSGKPGYFFHVHSRAFKCR